MDMPRKRYTIDYGFGIATLRTPYPPEERFFTLAGTCFGIRKSIMHCKILKEEPDTNTSSFESLEFSGDAYIWREDGARRQVMPLWAADDEWDTDFCEECRYTGESNGN